MSSRKRKRSSRDIKCVFFPDDVRHGLHKVGRETSSLSSLSSARSWERCGESFLDTPMTKTLQSSGRKLSAIKNLSLVQPRPFHCEKDLVHIAWSSSDSEQSDSEMQLQSRVVPQQLIHKPRPTASSQSYTRALLMLSTSKEDLPDIDTDSDLDVSEVEAEKDSGQQISDCESESPDEKPEEQPHESENMKELEISGYVSDGEDTVISSRLNTESPPLQTGEGSKRSVGDWLKSAQAMLQTPQKPNDTPSRTPEDSAKKKKKFQRGGLAERLNRLQCRQRSAVSFWKHQYNSDTSAATTATVDRPGVLVLEVLEVTEECSMQLALCEHHLPPRDGHQHSKAVSEDTARMLVLFNRQTAAQLMPAPRDIIHIYPPWQSLSIEGLSCPVILNTHFSQKVCSAANTSIPGCRFAPKKCMPYYLGKIFGLLEASRTTEMNKQVTPSDSLCSFGGSGVLREHCDSLLEAIEALGQAGSVDQDVEVIVQRVYAVPIGHCSPASIIKPRVPLRSSAALPPAEKGKTRLCVLVQDSYGMFSVVQLHPLPCKDDLHQYCQMWQGKTCVLRNIKVVQRVTRERRSRLFSLIDSLWPPAMPLKEHGSSLSMPSTSRASGPAPSFCYLLSGQQSSVEATKEQAVSPLYCHPLKRTLRDILQGEGGKICRCSFDATVLYKRMQSPDVGHGEVWMVLTDPSLQEEECSERPCRRTVALCVNTSCVLTSSVLEALSSPAACRMSFRDAISENDFLLCAEQSVIEPEGSLKSTTRPESVLQPQSSILLHPVRLDPLSVETTPNSLCALTGVIVGVDENTAYTWPACNHCGSGNLDMSAERTQSFHCVSCKSAVIKPDTKVQLEVFLSCSSLKDCTVKVKLQKKTIMSILNSTALESDEFPGYDVENVLGKEVGPIAVYVQVVTRKPALWISLEEICL
ncbi:DNA repair-scaffolding protein [Parambassis ranga]|uniref:DNA repair-scaffolding protein n=1 Tax=Parambassis ranga TaxID=210632 RepID=A0A6P7K013_9TELE|nr:DNA repair-scaffolding protein [Parambassis ranga]